MLGLPSYYFIHERQGKNTMRQLELFDDGYIVDEEEEKRYKISFIGAEYRNDRPEVLGVSRITDLEIECEDVDIPDDLLYEAKKELWNTLADVEYFDDEEDDEEDFDEDNSSRRIALKDICRLTGVKEDIVDINY